MSERSQEFFKRTLMQHSEEASKQIELCLDSYLQASGGADRKAAAARAITAVDNLIGILHIDDRPGWLRDLRNSLEIARDQDNNTAGVGAMKTIAVQHFPAMRKHSWDAAFDTPSSSDWDVESLFAQYRAESKLSQLFDSIVVGLRKLVDSGEIDSNKMLRELRDLIALLEKAKGGSYTAARSALWYLGVWIKHAGIDLAKTVPGLGSVIVGIEKTMEEANVGMEDVRAKVITTVKATAQHRFPNLSDDELPGLPYVPEPMRALPHNPDVETFAEGNGEK